MPALNIIAIHDTVRNSGASSSRPSGIRPYLLIASQSAKTTKPLAARTKAQPPPVMTPPSTAVATALSESVPSTPQAMNARTSTAATPNTTRSNGKCCASALLVQRRRLERWNNPYVVVVGWFLCGHRRRPPSQVVAGRLARPIRILRPLVHGNVSFGKAQRHPVETRVEVAGRQ